MERISFRATYGNERMTAALFLPKHVPPPGQAVVYAPGAGALQIRSSKVFPDVITFDYLVQSGRAVLYPIYQGTYERGTGRTSPWPERTRAYQDWLVHVVNDARRGIDYLESRPDIRHDEIGFVGTSWGATIGPRVLAQEPRLKAAVLQDVGFPPEGVAPELDLLNYVPRVTVPTLVIAGDNDFIFPVEASQKPFVARLGTPAALKRHVVLPGGHFIIAQQRSRVVREGLDWLDRHLPPIRR